MANRRILILDDDEAVGQTIQWIAEGLDFDAEFVTHAEQFFERVSETNPEILTIDLAMPELDGVEIMRLLAASNCRARIVISSGMGTRVLEAAQRSAQEHGLCILGVLSKPVSRDSMRQLIGSGGDVSEPARESELPTESIGFEITRADLQHALEHEEFFPAYQPKIVCKTRKPAGFEVLARWRHPSGCVAMPEDFIELTEQMGLIDTLSGQIFNSGLEWFSRGFTGSDQKLSLNLSAKSLVDINLADKLANLCANHRVAAESVVLELTETSAMVDPILSLDVMTRIRVKGFQLSIDDFGTGYSSMVQLVRLPFSEIKVDKSFVMNAMKSHESRTVIRSIIDLGHSLGLQVTAEGVEDIETFNYLTELGCDLAQGYFIALPMTGEAAAAWFEPRA